MASEIHQVPIKVEPKRLADYLRNKNSSYPTKSALKKALSKGLIKVNHLQANTATLISGGETITIKKEVNKPLGRELVFPLEVVYEDDYLAIINKPAGILVSGNSFKTITNALVQNLNLSSQNDSTKPQPVHRLDYPTTGLLLAGKTGSSITELNKLFENKQIHKQYLAITIGEMPQQKGVIINEVDDKPAESHYKVLQTVASKRFDFLNLLELSPKTGRRHQLRKHLATIGNPILGDKEYGKEGLILNGKGLYLHAFSLDFTHPFTEEKLQIKSNVPSRFSKIIDCLS